MRGLRRLITAVLLCAPTTAMALPGLSVYIDDAGNDVFVAVFGSAALQLDGCTSQTAARRLLQLPSDTGIRETTLGDLQQDFALGEHPGLPCTGTPFDAGWPATAPIWADLEDSGRYFLPAPGDGGLFYALSASCDALKETLAIRQRLQLPGVLQAMFAPPDLDRQVVIDCGLAAGGDVVLPDTETDRESGWSLHRFETFLSEESTGDTILVARYRPPGEAPPSYLPIWRVNDSDVASLLLAAGSPAIAMIEGVLRLLGLQADAEVGLLGAEAVVPVRSMVHVDLCLTNCDGYRHRHAVFADQQLDLSLTDISLAPAEARISHLGGQQIAWQVFDQRTVTFEECGRLGEALGIAPVTDVGWEEALDRALTAPAPLGFFSCESDQTATCRRQVADGATPTPALFSAGADCAGAGALHVTLPALTRFPEPLDLTNTGFESIVIEPAAEETAQLTIAAEPAGQIAAPCIQATTQALVLVDGLRRLVFRNVSLVRDANGATGQATGIVAQDSAVTLQDSSLGSLPVGSAEIEHGVTICQGTLYIAGSELAPTDLAVQGIAAGIAMIGTQEQRTVIGRPRFGLVLRSDSVLRAQHASIVSRTPITLRGATATVRNVELAPAEQTGSTAVWLERKSSADLTLSSVRGFGCVAGLRDPASRAVFRLPGNDLAADNNRLSCGAGEFTLLE